MTARPHILLPYYCDNPRCRSLIALLPPGALLYDTRLQCPQCKETTKLIKTIDKNRASLYTESQLAPV